MDADETILGEAALIESGEETLAPGNTAAKPGQRGAIRTGGVTPRPGRAGTPNPAVLSSSSDPIGGGRFAPGAIVAERYRIVALLGKGGMGEVYRAEDLRLSQVLAIKFLPEALSQDVSALARFHSEVRVARQVSHPNVCRMFDIGDADGWPFLTMEYVDGEDLSSLVRRIGRLPQDKAIEIARQICAGLAAAHERGVVHRDLKPANIMLDGAGKARITDFGLAGIAATIQGAEIRAGTPAYMAPEQLSGKEVTTKSDIYSLGLVMYEMLTGRRAYDATTLPELMPARTEWKDHKALDPRARHRSAGGAGDSAMPGRIPPSGRLRRCRWPRRCREAIHWRRRWLRERRPRRKWWRRRGKKGDATEFGGGVSDWRVPAVERVRVSGESAERIEIYPRGKFGRGPGASGARDAGEARVQRGGKKRLGVGIFLRRRLFGLSGQER